MIKFSINKLILVFILLSLVSLTADIVYEGARSIGGSYLQSLNAPPEAAAIASLGDFIGYAMRFVSGLLASIYSSSTILWVFTATGYLGILLLPFLAYTSVWQIATTIYLIERIGKGMRTPSRDTILADVTEDIGRGKAFGIHELMDQIGALTGPLIVATCIAISGFSLAFRVLFIPAIISIVLVLTAWRTYPKIRSIRVEKRKTNLLEISKLNKTYWLYVLSMIFLSLGYIHWFIVSYYARKWGIMSDYEIAIAYTIAMGIDALIALPIGYLYDKTKLKSLYIAPVLALTIPVILYSSISNRILFYLMAGVWGIVMCIYEVNMRVAIADLVENTSRALAYGIFGLIYGISWAIGGFIISFTMNLSVLVTIAYIVSVEIVSLLILVYLNKTMRI